MAIVSFQALCNPHLDQCLAGDAELLSLPIQTGDTPHDSEALGRLSRSMNSYLGQLRQIDGYRARRGLCLRVESLFMRPDAEFTKVLPHG